MEKKDELFYVSVIDTLHTLLHRDHFLDEVRKTSVYYTMHLNLQLHVHVYLQLAFINTFKLCRSMVCIVQDLTL